MKSPPVFGKASRLGFSYISLVVSQGKENEAFFEFGGH